MLMISIAVKELLQQTFRNHLLMEIKVITLKFEVAFISCFVFAEGEKLRRSCFPPRAVDTS